jgi:hypothetical protein
MRLKKDLAGQKETFYWAKLLMFIRGKQGKRRKKTKKPNILLGNLEDEMKASQLTRTKSQKTLWEIP